MSRRADTTGRTQRIAALLLFCCTTLALANLPAKDLPPGWLLTFTLPGAVLGLLRNHARRPWQRALLALILQAGACWLALATVGPMTRPAALACTILPPLAFVTARQRESDASLGLFLSFCVLLVGVILDGIDVPLIAAYASAGCWSLYAAAHLAARAVSKPPTRSRRVPHRIGEVLRTSLGIAVACLFAAFAIDRSLAFLPSPSGQRSAATNTSGDGRSGPRSVGISDSFVLDGGRGVLSEMHGEQLVRVRAEAGASVPTDLYLRSGFFTVPGLDRWQLGTLEQTQAPSTEALAWRKPLPRVATTWLELERFAGARNFVFVPPGTYEIRGLDGLVVDAAREWLRQQEGRPQSVYEVAWQRPEALPAQTRIDARAGRDLLTLPADLERGPFEKLLDEWQVGDQPQDAMHRIAAGLAQRCRYDRIEPFGPHQHAILNFLFADGDRRGYCMHFASAAALMLRLRGVACRIGVGLYGGDADREEPGARIYGSQHAHAWVEVPCLGRGYVVFDPTPPAERGRRTPSRLDTTPIGQDAPLAAGQGSPLAGFLDFLMQPWLLAVVLLLALASALWPTGAPQPPRILTPPSAKNARRLLVRLMRALAAAGHLRNRGQTLESFARDLSRRDRLPPEVSAAFTAYQEVRFGGRVFDSNRERVLLGGLTAAARLEPAAGRAPALTGAT